MSGELGLANNFRKFYEPLQRYRGSDGTPGREISMEKYLQTRARNEDGKLGLKNTVGQPITMEDIWNDLGIDPQKITLDNLISLSGSDTQYFAPEIVRQFVVEGLESDSDYLDLVNSSQNVGAMVITSPWIQYNDARPEGIGEAETIPVGSLEYGYKTVELHKSAKGIEFSDEVLLSCPLNLLGDYLREEGEELSAMLFRAGVTVMINGDQSSGADSCPTIGVTSAGTLDYPDFLRCWTRGRRIKNRWVNMLTNEAQANTILEIDEFKLQQGLGGRRVEIDSNAVVPSSVLHRISEQLTDNQSMLWDKRAMDYLIFRALLVENDRIIRRQISGSFASIISGFTTLKRIRRVIIDKSITFAANPFPAYMALREDS